MLPSFFRKTFACLYHKSASGIVLRISRNCTPYFYESALLVGGNESQKWIQRCRRTGADCPTRHTVRGWVQYTKLMFIVFTALCVLAHVNPTHSSPAPHTMIRKWVGSVRRTCGRLWRQINLDVSPTAVLTFAVWPVPQLWGPYRYYTLNYQLLVAKYKGHKTSILTLSKVVLVILDF